VPPDVTPQSILTVLEAAVRAQVLAEAQAKPQPSSVRRLMTSKQAGECLGRSESAVRMMIFKQQIPVVRIGRNVQIDRSDLDRLIDDAKM
jgi:excisionase family DNA binding protein